MEVDFVGIAVAVEIAAEHAPRFSSAPGIGASSAASASRSAAPPRRNASDSA